jgi:hypothetical protein
MGNTVKKSRKSPKRRKDSNHITIEEVVMATSSQQQPGLGIPTLNFFNTVPAQRLSTWLLVYLSTSLQFYSIFFLAKQKMYYEKLTAKKPQQSRKGCEDNTPLWLLLIWKTPNVIFHDNLLCNANVFERIWACLIK